MADSGAAPAARWHSPAVREAAIRHDVKHYVIRRLLHHFVDDCLMDSALRRISGEIKIALHHIKLAIDFRPATRGLDNHEPKHPMREVIRDHRSCAVIDEHAWGATVTLVDEDTDEKKTYQIVCESEAGVKAGRVSITSPTARALIGKKTSDSVEVNTPGGGKSYEILNVAFQ